MAVRLGVWQGETDELAEEQAQAALQEGGASGTAVLRPAENLRLPVSVST